MDIKAFERKLVRRMRRIRADDKTCLLAVRPWQVFLMVSTVQFTKANGKFHEQMHAELNDLNGFLTAILVDAAPYMEKIMDLGTNRDLDVGDDGKPVHPERYAEYMKRLAEEEPPNDGQTTTH